MGASSSIAGIRRARRLRAAAAALGAIVVLLAIAPSASALSRPAAVSIALRALAPGRLRGPVKVFSLPAPVPRGQYVYEAGLTGVQHVRPLPFPVWLFWEDQAAGAEFAHSSVLLLLDARTGRIVTRRTMLWLLYVGGTPAPFLRSRRAYDSSRYVVYANRAVAARAHPAAGGGYAPAKNRKAALAKDCLVTIVDSSGFQFAGDKAAMDRFADAVGLRRFDVRLGDLFELKRTVEAAHNSGCTDVFLFIAGHGRFPKSFWQGGENVSVVDARTHERLEQPPGVNVRPRFVLDRKTGEMKDESSYITPQYLVELVRPYSGSFGRVEFKIKIDSCFAGRFEQEVFPEKNVVAMEFASRADETGWYMSAGSRVDVASPTTHRFTGRFMTDHVENPDNATTFVNGNVHGLFDWAATAPLDEPLYSGITGALDRGKTSDFARTVNWSHPYVVKRPPTVELPPVFSVFGIGAGDDGLFSIAAGGTTARGSRARSAASPDLIAFTESTAAKIGLMNTAGSFTAYPTTPGFGPQQIAYGPDDNFWFTEYDGTHAAIGRITAAGVVTTFDLPGSLTETSLDGIAAGPDGNLWFTESTPTAAKIGVMSTTGTLLHEYTVLSNPPQFFQLFLITAGPDGNMWFTETGSEVGRISMAGGVSQFPITVGVRQPFGITAGPDGKIWMALQGGIAGVARINVDGTGYTEFKDPDGGFPNQIAAGPDGNLWYVDHASSGEGGDQIARVTPAGQITEFTGTLPASSGPTAITAGPDGRMWFTLAGANEVGAATTH